jgi:hypothetical protein
MLAWRGPFVGGLAKGAKAKKAKKERTNDYAGLLLNLRGLRETLFATQRVQFSQRSNIFFTVGVRRVRL